MSPVPRASYEDLVSFDRKRTAERSLVLAGVDEAGRGALAGPVVAAAVVCDPCPELSMVKDSKLLQEPVREELFEIIREKSAAFSTGIVEPDEIDRTNILKATLKAMKRAVEGLAVEPSLVIIDGRNIPDIPFRSEAVVGADGKSFSVAAASIVAKVSRDRIMRKRDSEYPGYGFVRNKGYGTREHIEAISKSGWTGIHRRSFKVRHYG